MDWLEPVTASAHQPVRPLTLVTHHAAPAASYIGCALTDNPPLFEVLRPAHHAGGLLQGVSMRLLQLRKLLLQLDVLLFQLLHSLAPAGTACRPVQDLT